mgnify:CR=1 FL=1
MFSSVLYMFKQLIAFNVIDQCWLLLNVRPTISLNSVHSRLQYGYIAESYMIVLPYIAQFLSGFSHQSV